MQHGGRKFEKIVKTKKKIRDSWDSWGEESQPKKLKEFKKRHHDRSTYRLARNEDKEYE